MCPAFRMLAFDAIRKGKETKGLKYVLSVEKVEGLVFHYLEPFFIDHLKKDVHMKLCLTLMTIFPLLAMADASSRNGKVETQRPADFLDIKKFIPEVQTDIRYFSEHNFVGRRIEGYQMPVCLLTEAAAVALKSVVKQLLPMGLTLKIYDCYRPQTAVNDFARWATDINDTKMRAEFYPTVEKSQLFEQGYIAYNSGHSRGSTLDLTIVPLDSHEVSSLTRCSVPQSSHYPENSLDFGTGFDCFSPASHPDYQGISAQARANRLLLRLLMTQAGFIPLDTEWWHFTLANEPYPDTYFDFPVR